MTYNSNVPFPGNYIFVVRSLTLQLCFVKLAGGSQIPKDPVLLGTGGNIFICLGKKILIFLL